MSNRLFYTLLCSFVVVALSLCAALPNKAHADNSALYSGDSFGSGWFQAPPTDGSGSGPNFSGFGTSVANKTDAELTAGFSTGCRFLLYAGVNGADAQQAPGNAGINFDGSREAKNAERFPYMTANQDKIFRSVLSTALKKKDDTENNRWADLNYVSGYLAYSVYARPWLARALGLSTAFVGGGYNTGKVSALSHFQASRESVMVPALNPPTPDQGTGLHWPYIMLEPSPRGQYEYSAPPMRSGTVSANGLPDLGTGRGKTPGFFTGEPNVAGLSDRVINSRKNSRNSDAIDFDNAYIIIGARRMMSSYRSSNGGIDSDAYKNEYKARVKMLDNYKDGENLISKPDDGVGNGAGAAASSTSGSAGKAGPGSSPQAAVTAGATDPYRNQQYVDTFGPALAISINGSKLSEEQAKKISTVIWSSTQIEAFQKAIPSTRLEMSHAITNYRNNQALFGVTPCQIDVPVVLNTSIGDLFDDPAQFLNDVAFSMAGEVASTAYNGIKPTAMKYALVTAHTERGDTIFDIVGNCLKISNSATAAQKNYHAQHCGEQHQNLGFTKANLSPENQNKHFWIKMANFLRWLVSAFYFVLLFAAATLYMVRGNASTNLNVLQLIPRLVLSIIVVLAAPFMIGYAVTFSNMFVSGLFSGGGFGASSGQGDTYSQMSTILDGLPQKATLEQSAARWVELIALVFVDIAMALMLVMSILRQIVFIVLVMILPVACFALLFRRSQHFFANYVKALVVTIFLPALFGLTLFIGVTMASLLAKVSGGDTDSFVDDILPAIIVALSFVFMVKLPGMLKKWMGGGIGSMLGITGANTASKALTRGGMLAGIAIGGPAGVALGGAMLGAGKTTGMVGGHQESIIPSQFQGGMGGMGGGRGGMGGMGMGGMGMGGGMGGLMHGAMHGGRGGGGMGMGGMGGMGMGGMGMGGRGMYGPDMMAAGALRRGVDGLREHRDDAVRGGLAFAANHGLYKPKMLEAHQEQWRADEMRQLEANAREAQVDGSFDELAYQQQRQRVEEQAKQQLLSGGDLRHMQHPMRNAIMGALPSMVGRGAAAGAVAGAVPVGKAAGGAIMAGGRGIATGGRAMAEHASTRLGNRDAPWNIGETSGGTPPIPSTAAEQRQTFIDNERADRQVEETGSEQTLTPEQQAARQQRAANSAFDASDRRGTMNAEEMHELFAQRAAAPDDDSDFF